MRVIQRDQRFALATAYFFLHAAPLEDRFLGSDQSARKFD